MFMLATLSWARFLTACSRSHTMTTSRQNPDVTAEWMM
jgi:hypothetical protein